MNEENEEIKQDFKIMRECDRCGNEDTIDIYTGFCPSCINGEKQE